MLNGHNGNGISGQLSFDWYKTNTLNLSEIDLDARYLYVLEAVGFSFFTDIENTIPSDHFFRKVYWDLFSAKLFKIGFARNVKGRCLRLNTGCPYNLTVWTVYQCTSAPKVEKMIHKTLEGYKWNKEFFFLSELDLALMLIDWCNEGYLVSTKQHS
jgi:hypothetical protein